MDGLDRPLQYQQTPRPTAPVGTPVRTSTPGGTVCFKCGENGHYANVCPKRNAPNTPVQSQQMQQMRNGNHTPQENKGQQSYARGKVNHMSIETAQENPQVVLGMFLVDSVPASVLFYSGASHLSFLLNLWLSTTCPCNP